MGIFDDFSVHFRLIILSIFPISHKPFDFAPIPLLIGAMSEKGNQFGHQVPDLSF